MEIGFRFRGVESVPGISRTRRANRFLRSVPEGPDQEGLNSALFSKPVGHRGLDIGVLPPSLLRSAASCGFRWCPGFALARLME